MVSRAADRRRPLEGVQPIPRHGLPLPGLGRFHPYAWTCFVLTMLGVVLNLLALTLSGSHSSLGLAVSLDAWIWAFPTYVIAGPIGLHALVKYRWPGRTATEKARKPQMRDVLLVGVAFLVGTVNLLVLLAAFGGLQLPTRA